MTSRQPAAMLAIGLVVVLAVAMPRGTPDALRRHRGRGVGTALADLLARTDTDARLGVRARVSRGSTTTHENTRFLAGVRSRRLVRDQRSATRR
jgi:hypothetical protein